MNNFIKHALHALPRIKLIPHCNALYGLTLLKFACAIDYPLNKLAAHTGWRRQILIISIHSRCGVARGQN